MTSTRSHIGLAGVLRGYGWIGLGLVVVGAIVFGAATATDVGQAQERVPELRAGNLLEMRIGQIYTFSVRSHIGPSEDDGTVIVHLGTDPETGDNVIAFQGNGALGDGQKHVSVYNRHTWWQGQRVTFRAEHAGTVWVTLQTVHPRHHRYHILKVVVKQQPAIVGLGETDGYSWVPLILDDNKYSPFHHVMGESEHITYQVWIGDPEACKNAPAKLEISGRPRYRFGAGHSDNHRFQIQKGAYDPDHGLTSNWEITETLEFDTGKCNEPQLVTVYGLTDFFSWSKNFSQYPAYVVLKHRVTQYNGHAVAVPEDRGVVEFKVYGEDRYNVRLSAAVPPASGSATTTRQVSYAGVTRQNIGYVNNVGPASRAGAGIAHFDEFWQNDVIETYLRLPQPSSDGTGGWVEFCIYVHGREKSLAWVDGRGDTIHKKDRSYHGVGLLELSPFPFEYEQLWFYLRGQSASFSQSFGRDFDDGVTNRVNQHYRLPIEIEYYTAIDATNTDCTTIGSGGTGGQWKTFYSGGPTTLDSQGNPAAWSDPTGGDVLTLPQEDWGKLINVRIRAAYGLPTGITDTTHQATIMNDGAAGAYRAPQGTMLLKFAFHEMIGAETTGSIIVTFE